MHSPASDLKLPPIATNPTASKPLGLFRLVAWIVPLAAFWLLALPWLSSRPSVAAYIQWLDDCGVDPSAMYYTDLEAMKPIRERLNVGAGLTSGKQEKTNHRGTKAQRINGEVSTERK